MLTRVSASGPLPISVAPFTGYWMRPFSTQERLARREDELAAGDVDLAAAEVGGVQAFTEAGDDLLGAVSPPSM